MIRITAEDLEDGETMTRDIDNDVCWVTAGTAYVASMQAWPNGTIQVVFKGIHPSPLSTGEDAS